jgi:hypothetical protein
VLADKETRRPLGGLRWFFRWLLRLGAEIVLGLAVVGAAWLEQRRDPPPSLGLPWTLFWTFTVLIFAAPVARYRHQWRRPLFWVVIGGLLTIHIAWWTDYIRSWFAGSTGGFGSSYFPVVVWVLWGLPEYGAIQALFYWGFSPDRRTITLGAFLDREKTAAKPDRNQAAELPIASNPR